MRGNRGGIVEATHATGVVGHHANRVRRVRVAGEAIRAPHCGRIGDHRANGLAGEIAATMEAVRARHAARSVVCRARLNRDLDGGRNGQGRDRRKREDQTTYDR